MLERTVVKPTDKTKEKDEDHRWNNKFIFSEHKRTWVAGPGEGQSNAAKRKKEKGAACCAIVY